METNCKKIKCKKCNGMYQIKDGDILQWGSWGLYGQCSNYPRCDSQIKIDEYIILYIRKNGVNIYKWEIQCDTCHKITPLYSHFLDYQLWECDENFEFFDMGPLGNFYNLDILIENEVASVREYNCLICGKKHIDNHCIWCNHPIALNNYPDELIAAFQCGRMNKYLWRVIKPDVTDGFIEQLRMYC